LSAPPDLVALAGAVAQRAERDLAALVDVSSPSGDRDGAEEAIARAAEQLPAGAVLSRLPCSTPGCAPDMLATVEGAGRGRLLLLGHLDTVHPHAAHRPLRRDGERLRGPGAVDMKGGCVLALGVARALASRPQLFEQVAVLLVTDEEWRTVPLVHVGRFASFDACLCFEGGERNAAGEEVVIVRRKAAMTLRVSARGEAAHSGSAPERGRSALLALARCALQIPALSDPAGADRLTVVPTVIRAGEAFNVVPASGELLFDMRARSLEALERVVATAPQRVDGVELRAEIGRRWPGMDSTEATAGLLQRASALLGRPIRGGARGGASDASHFAAAIPLTVDGLGPLGGGAHKDDEFIWRASLRSRAEVALAVATAALAQAGG
jgi:glutamate carboxypeptidase